MVGSKEGPCVIHMAKPHEAPAVAVEDSYKLEPQWTVVRNTICREYNVERNNRNTRHERAN